MAHNNFNILEKLIKLLDFEGNDIYIHIDIKVKEFNQEYFSKIPRNSNIYFIDRMPINWGGTSQIICELNLLDMAVSKQYCYYHLLSGVDLPLKSQNYIHNFFEKNNGKEFVGFGEEWDKSRVKYFYLFNEVGRSKDPLSKIKMLINKVLIQIQKWSGYERYKNLSLAKGG